MNQQYLLAIDAGTGSIRAVLFDTSGRQIDCVQEEWEHHEDPRWPGSMDFDWTFNWNLASSCIKRLIAKTKINNKDIAGISTTCMREGIVLYNKEGKEIWACANVDGRSVDEVAELIRQNPALEKVLYSESGQTYALGALPRLLWIKNKLPHIYEETAVLGMFNDWLIHKLTGVLAVEPSNGSTTGIFDLKKRSWNPEIAKQCGLRDDIFPPVQECGTKAGYVTESAAAETGLAAGTPVIVGGGDCQLGCIGVGAVNPGDATIFGGSFWQYEYNTESGQTDPECRVRVNCHAVPNLWQFEALAFKPGLVMRWYRDAFCQQEKELAKQNGDDPYNLMNQEAEKIPAGCYGMMCTFSDVMNFIQWKHAAPSFLNFELDAEKFNRYTFYRAILENAALITKGHMELVQASTGKAPSHVVFAGGASKSPLWCQILADVLNLEVRVPVVKEATALGAAILAGYGVGIYKDISSAAKECVKWDKVYTPNAENHAVYQRMYPVWREVYKAQLELCDRKLTKNMWIAPGIS